MLAIARELAPYDVPLIGINQGRLGFITDIQLKDVPTALPQILAGQFEREQRAMLEGAVMRPLKGGGFETIYEGHAINEVVVSRGATASMVELRAEVDECNTAIHKPVGMSSAQVIRDCQNVFLPSALFAPVLEQEREMRAREPKSQQRRRSKAVGSTSTGCDAT